MHTDLHLPKILTIVGHMSQFNTSDTVTCLVLLKSGYFFSKILSNKSKILLATLEFFAMTSNECANSPSYQCAHINKHMR